MGTIDLLIKKAIIIIFFPICINAQGLLLNEFNNSIDYLGIKLQFDYTGEIFSNLSDGLKNKLIYLDNVNLKINSDLEKNLGWHGAKLNAYILGNNGGSISKYCGAIQGTSNIEAYNTWKIYEFWIEQNFGNNLSLLVGLFDLNSEFDNRETSNILINPSHGIGAEFALSGYNGPSIFPTTSLAIRTKYNFSNTLNLKFAIFDGIPGDIDNPFGTKILLEKKDGFLYTTEINLICPVQNQEIEYYKYAVGFWYYSSEFEKLMTKENNENSLMQLGNYGFYLFAEKFIYPEDIHSEQGLSGFFRLGYADNKVNKVDGYFGTGINYVGLIPGRNEDIFGLGISIVHISSYFQKLTQYIEHNKIIADYEYICELTYKFSLFDYLTFQPDLQYIINPTLSHFNNNTIVFGSRFNILF